MNLTTNPICLSLRYNAACCIRLRHLRDLRENNTQEYSIYIAQMKPQCLSQIIADTPQNFNNLTSPSLTVFLCAIMQPAAFLCVICAICGRITRKRSQSIRTNETPMSLADLADLRRQTPKPQNSLNLKQPVFLCEIIQLAVFLCVICAICGRITRKSTQ